MTRLLVLACALAAAVLLPSQGAYAGAPVVTISPDSGGPGTVVTVAGVGFCARTGCSVVSLTLAGRRFAPEQQVTSSGRFRVKAQVSGGYTSGGLEVVARQVLEDGNELTAGTVFTYAPSKGEASERDAETNDQTTHLINPSAPVSSPKGVPFASFAASAAAGGSAGPASGSATAGTSAAGSGSGSGSASSGSGGSGRSAPLWLLAGAAVLGSAGLVVASTGRRRARNPGPVAEGSP